MIALIRKELKTYLSSPIGYIFIAVYIATMGFFYAQELVTSGSLYFEQIVQIGGSVSAFFLPILTMRMFAEEKKSGTEQLLLTSPLNATQIVLGKFLSALLMVILVCAVSLIFFIMLLFFGTPKLKLVFYTYIGFIMLSSAYISIGMFISSITENQVVAGIITLAVVIINTIVPQYVSALKYYDFMNIYAYMTYGEFTAKGITLFISTTILFILLTIIVIQRRKCTR